MFTFFVVHFFFSAVIDHAVELAHFPKKLCSTEQSPVKKTNKIPAYFAGKITPMDSLCGQILPPKLTSKEF